eukprot:210422_1
MDSQTRIPSCDITINEIDGTVSKLSFDLLDNTKRKECCALILESLHFTSTKSIEMFNAYIGFRILGNEIILNTKKFKFILNQFYRDYTKLNSIHIDNFVQFICTITENKLLIKFILSDPLLWKPFIQSIVLNTNKQYDFHLLRDLLKTVRFWKKHHYSFFVHDSTIVNCVRNAIVYHANKFFDKHYKQIKYLYNQRQLNTKSFWNKMYDLYSCKDEKGNIVCELYYLESIYQNLKIFVIAANVPEFYQSFLASLQREYQNCYNRVKKNAYKRFYYKKLIEFTEWSDRHKQIVTSKEKRVLMQWCDYSKCNQLLKNLGCNSCKANSVYLCKGCKLVAYCGRNHQKKDWKILHQHQCLKLLNNHDP